MEERVGFVGVVIEDLSQAARVNQVVGQFQDMVTGRIGVPDHERGIAVIGLLVRGDSARVGAFTGRLGNIPGVQVKSALAKSNTTSNERKQET
ncbi:MAG: CopG family transcriptional regulator [Clostridiales bacterium]|nr:CopG family transcriptional regulator [Clostridiales bacterium]